MPRIKKYDKESKKWIPADKSITVVHTQGGAGITAEQIIALDEMFKVCTFKDTPTKEYEAFKKAFGIGGGTPIPPDPEPEAPVEKIYSVTNNLTNVKNSNGVTSIKEKSSYSGKITADNGFTLNGASATIIMGGTNITSTAYSNGNVTIPSVTGNIVITISAKKEGGTEPEVPPAPTEGFKTVYTITPAEMTNGKIVPTHPYLTTNDSRVSYIGENGNTKIALKRDTLYKVKCTNPDLKFGVQELNSRAWEDVTAQRNISYANDKFDSGWIEESEYMFSTKDKGEAHVWLTFEPKAKAPLKPEVVGTVTIEEFVVQKKTKYVIASEDLVSGLHTREYPYTTTDNTCVLLPITNRVILDKTKKYKIIVEPQNLSLSLFKFAYADNMKSILKNEGVFGIQSNPKSGEIIDGFPGSSDETDDSLVVLQIRRGEMIPIFPSEVQSVTIEEVTQ